jgi:long-subunit fatty acid transport protein
MKQYILLALTFLSVFSTSAQNEADALRFSQYFYGGTARSLSMGGAFGALGGDFSSLSINPAGIGVYRGSEFTITPTMNYNSSTADYLGSKYTNNSNNFLLNNLGFVTTFNTKKTDGWISANLGLGYNKLNDFNGSTYITGVNNSSSLLDNFIQNAKGQYPANSLYSPKLDPFYEELAYDADLIYNPDTTVMPPSYLHDLLGKYGELQEKSVSTSGGIGEYLISFGANYNNKLYLGASLGIQDLSYSETDLYTEKDTKGVIPYLNTFTLSENYNTHGTGYAFKFGAIYKPVEMLRIGLAVHFPTYYSLNSNFSTSLNVNFKHEAGFPDNTAASSPLAVNDYSMTTPWQMIGSVAYQFGTIGLLSADVERVDYSTMQFNNTSEFKDVNDSIQKHYKTALNFRFGCEVKLGSIALRAGYAIYGSPFVKGYGNDNASNSRISAGIGFRGLKFFCDLAYVMAIQKANYTLYQVNGVLDQASLTNMSSQIMATIGFRF